MLRDSPVMHVWAGDIMLSLGSGPTPTSLVVVRQCARCKRKEMAKVTAGMWTEAKGDYRRTEHYDIG